MGDNGISRIVIKNILAMNLRQGYAMMEERFNLEPSFLPYQIFFFVLYAKYVKLVAMSCIVLPWLLLHSFLLRGSAKVI